MGFLPFTRTFEHPAEGSLVLIALLNPDAFANFQEVTLNDPAAAAALTTGEAVGVGQGVAAPVAAIEGGGSVGLADAGAISEESEVDIGSDGDSHEEEEEEKEGEEKDEKEKGGELPDVPSAPMSPADDTNDESEFVCVSPLGMATTTTDAEDVDVSVEHEQEQEEQHAVVEGEVKRRRSRKA